VAVAVIIGLGGVATATGMALGAVGAVSSAQLDGAHHHRWTGPGPLPDQ
jgi:hypothetical protein